MGSSDASPSQPSDAAPAVSFLSLPPYLLQRILLSLPGGPGSSAAGAVCACKELYTAWRTDLGRPEVIAVHLRARYPGDTRAALSYVYGQERLRSLLLPPGPEVEEDRAMTLLELAARLGAAALLQQHSVADTHAVAQTAAAAAVVHVAASAAADDAGVVRSVLARLPGCCSRAQLNSLLAEAAAAGLTAVAEALLESGAEAASAALGWDPLAALQAGHADTVALLLRYGSQVPFEQLLPLIELACQPNTVGLLRPLLRAAQEYGAGWLAHRVEQRMQEAAASGDTAVVEGLLAADVPAGLRESCVRGALNAAVAGEHVATIAMLLRAGASAKAAFLSVITEDTHIGRLQALLQAGWDVSDIDYCFGVSLVQRRQRLLLRALLQVPGMLQYNGSKFGFMLEAAVEMRDVESARLLVSAGTSPAVALTGVTVDCNAWKLELLEQAGCDLRSYRVNRFGVFKAAGALSNG